MKTLYEAWVRPGPLWQCEDQLLEWLAEVLRGHKSRCTACACRLIQLQLCIILANITEHPSISITTNHHSTIQPDHTIFFCAFLFTFTFNVRVRCPAFPQGQLGASFSVLYKFWTWVWWYKSAQNATETRMALFRITTPSESEISIIPLSSLCHPFVIPLSQPRISRCFSDGTRATNKLAAST